MSRNMTSRRTRLSAVVAAVLLALTASGPASASDDRGGDPDVMIGVDGTAPYLRSPGQLFVSWKSTGTADVTGVTHLTLDLPQGMRMYDVPMMYSMPYDYSFAESLSPDGRHVDATFTGTMVPGREYFMKTMYYAPPDARSGVIRATVANQGDTDPSDNVATMAVNTPKPPAETPPEPKVSDIGTSGGPGTGGTAVTVTGSHLADGFVLFGNDPATDASCTESSCVAHAPGGKGTVPVTVVTPGGTDTADDGFTYSGPPPAAPPAPVVTRLTPSSGPASGGGHAYVQGTNLAQGTVFFGDRPAEHVSCGPAFCSATPPAGAGTVDVTVTTRGGRSTAVPGGRYVYTP